MDIGVPELVIILIIVLLIFGPGRIVKVGREFGVGIRQFKQGLEPTKPEKTDEKRSTDG